MKRLEPQECIGRHGLSDIDCLVISQEGQCGGDVVVVEMTRGGDTWSIVDSTSE